MTVTEIDEIREGQKEITIQGEVETRKYLAPYNARLKVEVGDEIDRGEVITEGSIDPKELIVVKDVATVQEYLLKEVQKVYRMQGVEIGDKHIEVMVRQMLRKVRVIEAGDTDLLPGSLLDIHQFADANTEVVLKAAKFQQHVVLSFSVLQKLHLKQNPSCLQHRSKKQLVS